MTVINKTDAGAVKKEPLLFKPVHEVIAVGFEWFCHKSVMFYIGMILFGVGSSFLIRYGMLNVTMTPEIAFSLIMFVCLSFLGMGWFLRKHRLYGLLFQSFAVGMLFLCLFAGMETFHIFSLWTGFGAMILLCFISGALAVFQDARVIAVIGIGGGFLAPLLFPVANAATEFLLGYYLLLTAGVCWISSRRSWDELQYLSFGFSATVALIWGPVDYEFHHFMKIESFLIAFFLIYSAVIFHRFRTRPEEGDHPGKLIFSLILPVFFTFFQTGMARHIPHVMAATFALLSIFYSLQVGILYQSGQKPRRTSIVSDCGLSSSVCSCRFTGSPAASCRPAAYGPIRPSVSAWGLSPRCCLSPAPGSDGLSRRIFMSTRSRGCCLFWLSPGDGFSGERCPAGIPALCPIIPCLIRWKFPRQSAWPRSFSGSRSGSIADRLRRLCRLLSGGICRQRFTAPS